MTTDPETCSTCGEPKPIVLDLENPDGTRKHLCRVCATRWLLSEEEWPPPDIQKA